MHAALKRQRNGIARAGEHGGLVASRADSGNVISIGIPRSDDRQPILTIGIGRMAKLHLAIGPDRRNRTGLQRSARARMKPQDFKQTRGVRKIKRRGFASFQINQIKLASFTEAIALAGGNQFVGVGHIPKGNLMFRKEVQGKAALFPHVLTHAVILAGQITVRVGIAEVPFDTGSAGHQVAP